MQVQVHKKHVKQDVKLLNVRGSGTFEKRNYLSFPNRYRLYTFHSVLMNAFRLFSICMTKGCP